MKNYKLRSLVLLVILGGVVGGGVYTTGRSSVNEASLGSNTLYSASGDSVTNATTIDTIHGLAILDPTLIADKNKISQIKQVDYYANDQLVQTEKDAPYYMNTKVVSNGQYTLRTVVTFKDDSVEDLSQFTTITNPADPVADNSGYGVGDHTNMGH